MTAYIIDVAPRGYLGLTEVEGHYAEIAKYISFKLSRDVKLELVPYTRAQMSIQHNPNSFSIMAESHRVMTNARSAGKIGDLQVGVLFQPSHKESCPVLTEAQGDFLIGRVLGTTLMPEIINSSNVRVIDVDNTQTLLKMYATQRLDGMIGMIHHWEHNWQQLDAEVREQLQKGHFCHYSNLQIHIWTGINADPTMVYLLQGLADNMIRDEVFSEIIDVPLQELNVIQRWTKAF